MIAFNLDAINNRFSAIGVGVRRLKFGGSDNRKGGQPSIAKFK
jgi:hypothetical protein